MITEGITSNLNFLFSLCYYSQMNTKEEREVYNRKEN